MITHSHIKEERTDPPKIGQEMYRFFLAVKLPWVPRGFWEDPHSRTNGTVVLSGKATSAHHHAQENHPSFSMGISMGSLSANLVRFLEGNFGSCRRN